MLGRALDQTSFDPQLHNTSDPQLHNTSDPQVWEEAQSASYKNDGYGNRVWNRCRAIYGEDVFLDRLYSEAIPYFLSGQTTLPPELQPKSVSYAHLLKAMDDLDIYLSFVEENRISPDIHAHLRAWHTEISGRDCRDTLLDSQRAELIEQIYTNLFLAQNPECKYNRERAGFASREKLPHIDRARELNEKIAHWNGWKVVAGLGLVFLGAVLIATAALAVASGYGVLAESIVTTVASFNGFALITALGYLGGCGVVKHQEWKRGKQREIELAKFNSGSKSPPEEEQSNTSTTAWICEEIKKSCKSLNTAVHLGFYTGSPVLAGVVANQSGMDFARLSLSKACSVKMTMTGGHHVGDLIGGSFILAGMLMVIEVGAHAMYQGFKMMKGQYDIAQKDKVARGHASQFLEALTRDSLWAAAKEAKPSSAGQEAGQSVSRDMLRLPSSSDDANSAGFGNRRSLLSS